MYFINATEYSNEQLDAWVFGKVNLHKWNDSYIEHYALVAVGNDTLLGFDDTDGSYYLYRLYVHKAYQGRGIAYALLETFETLLERDSFDSEGYSIGLVKQESFNSSFSSLQSRQLLIDFQLLKLSFEKERNISLKQMFMVMA